MTKRPEYNHLTHDTQLTIVDGKIDALELMRAHKKGMYELNHNVGDAPSGPISTTMTILHDGSKYDKLLIEMSKYMYVGAYR